MTQAASLADRLSRELPELLELRRHLHAHPELSGEEHQTAALVAGELRQLGWRVREGVGRTGVVAELGPDHGPTVGLRVDMDALPVEERTGLRPESFMARLLLPAPASPWPAPARLWRPGRREISIGRRRNCAN